jgi:hypothetical protein
MGEDRKYRHRGYMDSSSESPKGRRGDAGPSRSDSPGGPRGRSAGIDKDLVLTCKGCGRKLPPMETIRAEAACPYCGASLHACRQCVRFDPGARWECSANARIPARIADKSASNDCPAYEPVATFDLTGSKPQGTADEARNAFDALFRKK